MERTIYLNRIDHTKESLAEALGVPKEELKNRLREVEEESPLKTETEIENLGFSKEELEEAITKSKSKTFSEILANLWKKRGREEISLKECAYTFIIVKKEIASSRDERSKVSGTEEFIETVIVPRIESEIRKRIIKLLKDHGTEVLVGTSHCDQWKKEHDESSKGCPSALGCTKFALLYDTIEAIVVSQPKPIRSRLDYLRSIDMTINGITVILKILEAKSLKDLDDLKDFFTSS
jgi:hypothetical protein